MFTYSVNVKLGEVISRLLCLISFLARWTDIGQKEFIPDDVPTYKPTYNNPEHEAVPQD